MEAWAQRLLSGDCQFVESCEEWDPTTRKRADEAGLAGLVILPLPGKQGPLGAIAGGSTRQRRFPPEELAYLVKTPNLLGLPLPNLHLFEQFTAGRRRVEYSFHS